MDIKQETYLLRAARNTLLDMLLESRGTTFPLADLPTSTPMEMESFNSAGKVWIDHHQADVSYQVFEGKEHYSEVAQSATRDGILLHTKLLTGESHAFSVVATKLYGEPLSKVLYKVVNIKVGVNKSLEVVAEKTQLIFNEKTTLTIKSPQKDALYYICTLNGNNIIPLSAEVVSEGGDLSIETAEGLKEDTILSIGVKDPNTKSSGVLDMKISIKVEPNIHLTAYWLVNTEDSDDVQQPALDYGGKAKIRLQNTQKSVIYCLFLKEMDSADVIESENWMGRELRGTDGDLDLSINGKLTEDLIIGIIARKPWSPPEGVLLKAEPIIPVKPALNIKLSVISNEEPDLENTFIQIKDPQFGVIYQLYRQKDGQLVGEPVFYHRNTGIGNTRIGGSYIADQYQVKDDRANWVKSEFVIGDVNISENNTLLLPVGDVKRPAVFYIIAKKSTTGFTERLPSITVA